MVRDLIAENWRLEKSRYALLGGQCTKCNIHFFPVKKLCTKCHSDENISEYHFNSEGKLVEWTRILEATSGFELQTPYYYGIIELDHGVRVSTQITSVTDESILEPGLPVNMVFRKLFEGGEEGVITYGFKAEPISK